MSAITSLAPWFGGKRTMAAEIVGALGPHSVYWEPFCGSMAVLLAKPPCKTEVANDLHGDLVNLARVIQHPRLGPALYRRLRRVLHHESLFRESLDAIRFVEMPEGEDLERAFHYFIVSWQGFNGVAGTPVHNTSFARRFSSTGGDTGTRWSGAVRSIPEWRRRLEGVQILRSDGIELCERIEDKDGVAIYADPPYFVKGATYVHDFRDGDHERLSKALHRFRRTRVVLSYYDDWRLGQFYPCWYRRPVVVARNMVNSGSNGKGGRVAAPEILLANLPWPDRARGLFD